MSASVAVFSTHPIQYQAPWLQGLARSGQITLKTYYGLIPDAQQQAGAFGVPFIWDIPLLNGYMWEVLPSARKHPGLGSFFGNSTPRIVDRLAAARPDVLIVTGWNSFPLVQVWLAGLRLGIPMLLRCEANAMRRRSWWVRAVHRAYLRTMKGCLAIGESNEQFYLDNGVDRVRIWKAPYFVDNARIRAGYDKDLRDRAIVRARWAVPREAYCFLYVGKLEPKKRIFDLLDALRIASGRASRPVHLLVVGSGELMSGAQARVKEHHLPVSFAGFLNQTQLTQAYAAGDCLVLPSDYGETWGLVVNEAMVCGLPTVVSDRVGCGPDLVRGRDTGEIFPFGDVLALAETMLTMADDMRRSREMGERALRLIQRYSADAAVRGTLEAIESIAPSWPR